MSTTLEYLQDWFSSRCDGEWEHTYGIIIETLDNPGWRVVVDLRDTPLAGRRPVSLEADRQTDDWIDIQTNADEFEGRGGPRNLGEILAFFRNWASEPTAELP